VAKEKEASKRTWKRGPRERALRSRVWDRTGLKGKTLWDLLELLIVPLMLVALGFWFTMQQDARQQRLEDQRAELERGIEDQRAQQATLQAYLDQMGTLLLDRDLREAEEDSDVRRIARARTLVVLEALGSDRKNRVLRFLGETELIQARPEGRPPIVSLKYAVLHDFELTGKQLLRDTDLTQAGLTSADLSEAHLEGTDLSGAHLGAADLRGAYLQDAKLSGAYLYDTDLRGAYLSGADLSDAEGRFESGAHMVRTSLDGAHLDGADLTNARVSEEQPREADSLEGATMPNGQKYEVWLKSCAQELGSAHRFLHELADPCLFGGSQLLQREGGRPHGTFVEVRLVAEAKRRVPRVELLRALEEADDLAVPGIRGHPIPGFR
jgi:hypothetical protein